MQGGMSVYWGCWLSRCRLLLGPSRTFRTFIQCSAMLNKKDAPGNTLYDNYKEKLEQAQQALGPLSDDSDDNEVHHKPHLYVERCGGQPSTRFYKQPDLNSVLKLDLVATKTADEITHIWLEHHKEKDCISAIMPSSQFLQLHTKASHCPMFVYPLPRGDGYEMWFLQFSGQRFYLTSLINYKRYEDYAPIAFTMTYYTELMKCKGIVLVHGEVDTTALTVLEAQNLTRQVHLSYGNEEQPGLYALLHCFNHKHEDFDYQVLLEQVKNIMAQ